MSAKFDGMSGEADPLLGNRAELPPGQPTDGFTVPQPNGSLVASAEYRHFVTVRGGAYFFLPGCGRCGTWLPAPAHKAARRRRYASDRIMSAAFSATM